MVVKKSPAKKSVEFKISAPEARRVGIAGDFNGWKPDSLTAKKDKKGVWKAAAVMPCGTYQYKFIVDGRWITDPLCPQRAANAFGTENSILVVK